MRCDTQASIGLPVVNVPKRITKDTKKNYVHRSPLGRVAKRLAAALLLLKLRDGREVLGLDGLELGLGHLRGGRKWIQMTFQSDIHHCRNNC